jgi:hypothetical protein
MDFSGLSFGTVADVGGWGVAFFVLLTVSRWVMVGKLISQSAHERELGGVINDRDDWRATARAKDETIRLLSESHGDMRDSIQVVEQFIRALPQARQQPRGGR